jgi:hypothetical protein
MTETEMRNWQGFCRNATNEQLRNIIKKERDAGRGIEALLAEMVLEQRGEVQDVIYQAAVQAY